MKKITIHCGDWSAVLLPEFGMNTVSLRCGDTPILREPATDSAFAKEPLLYGIPVIFPANRTHGARFTFEGVEYRLPMTEPERNNNLHGSLYNTAFEVCCVTENSVVSRIVNRGEHYPFDFTLTFTDTVTPDGYLREAVLTNDVCKYIALSQSKLGCTPFFFAYPNGKYTKEEYFWKLLYPLKRMYWLYRCQASLTIILPKK